MEYASMLFLLLFLVLFLVTQFLIPSVKWKNYALLLFSLVFYAWAGPVHLLVLLGLTLVCWFFGLQIRLSRRPAQKKGLLMVAMLVILICLAGFSYNSFLLGTIRTITGRPQVLPQVILPLGMTVYCLQMLSYLLDIYYGDLQPEPNILKLLTYTSLFYVSMGGPILRYGDAKKALSKRRLKIPEVSKGITRICMGAAKRYLLADSLSAVIDQYLIRSTAELAGVPVTGLWLGVILWAVRLYLRLSAYADVAVGIGQCCGIAVPENFSYPILSLSLTTFLRKWLITLGEFFRRYVEGPFSRHKTRPIIGSCIAFILMGLWLGGSWTYVLWGIFVALCLFVEKRYLRRMSPIISGVCGVIGIFFSFVFLSFTTMSRLGVGLRGLFGLNGNGFFRGEFFAGTSGVLLIILSLLFCLPLGTLAGNIWRNRFKDNLLMMTVSSVWEAVFPIALLALTAFWLLRFPGVPFLVF